MGMPETGRRPAPVCHAFEPGIWGSGPGLLVCPATAPKRTRGRHHEHQRAAPGKEAGIISKEAPIQLSNIALRDPKDGKTTRVRFQIKDDGSKVRVAARSGEAIDG